MSGRPKLSIEEKAKRKEEILQKIAPYLKIGLSINKALREAKIPNSEFYKYMNEDQLFGEKVQLYKQYVSVLLNNTIVRELHSIIAKQNGDLSKGIQPQRLNKEEVHFLMWYALHNNQTIEEYGRKTKTNNLDVETGIQKVLALIQESSTKEVIGYELPID